MKLYSILFSLIFLASACSNPEQAKEDHSGHSHNQEQQSGQHDETLTLNGAQISALDLTSVQPTQRNMSEFVEASGYLEVPPQNEAIVTAIVGANIYKIQVIEGQDVKKGQTLAYLSHPNLLNIQTQYVSAKSEFDYTAENYKRQQKLYNEKVGSGQELQKVKSEYLSLKGQVQSLEYQLNMLGLSPEKIANGDLVESVPVKAPIEGSIKKVLIKTAQYVSPETELFEIINNHHVHADLMVFEKDMSKVKVGQKIRFTTTAINQEMTAEIYSVGKSFEEDPKAVHIHADIDNTNGQLIPGMYINGQIMVNTQSSLVLPSDAVVKTEDGYLAFQVVLEEDDKWILRPVAVRVGLESGGFTEIKLPQGLETASFAGNQAYFLWSEKTKEEAGHSH